MKYRPTTDEELSLILEEGEGYTLEFKRAVNSDLSKELVAFANASGGRILIGVDDHNTIVGCDVSNKALSQIDNMAASCDPPVAIHLEKLSPQKILVIHVPEGANRHHRCNKGFFLRNGANVMVEVFDDRVEIYNPGGLPKGLQEKDFGRRSVCRNPNIASLLLRCDYIEKMGSGIERIHTALAEAQCPEVKIRFNTMFTLEFPRPTFSQTTDSGNASTAPTPHVTPHDTPHVTPHVKRLLSVLQDEMTRGELMESIELKDRMYFSKEYLTPALHAGLIEMTIPDKPKSKLQKYRLTEKGRINAAK